MTVTVSYEIQGEPGTVLTFQLDSSTRVVTLAQIRLAFPLQGEWHFRVREPMGEGYCWRDLQSDHDEVGLGKKLHLKVLPIALPQQPQQQPQQDQESASSAVGVMDYDEVFGRFTTRPTPPPPAASATTTTTTNVVASIDEKFAKLGNSMFSAFKSVVKNVS